MGTAAELFLGAASSPTTRLPSSAECKANTTRLSLNLLNFRRTAIPMALPRHSLFQLPPSLRVSLALSHQGHLSRPRFFSSPTRCLLAQATRQKAKPPPPKTYSAAQNVVKKTQPASSRGLTSPEHISFQGSTIASLLARAPQPTILYKAPSFKAFAVSSYSASTFLMGWAAWHFSTVYLNPPEGLMWWVVPAYGVSTIVMFGMGLWIMSAPQRLVKTITAIPGAGPLRVRIVASRTLAHPRGKVMEVPVTDVTLRQSMSWVEGERVLVKASEERIAHQEFLEKQEGWWLRPLLAITRGLRKSIIGTLKHGRNYWNRADFILVDVKEKGSWKVNWREGELPADQRGIIIGQLFKLG